MTSPEHLYCWVNNIYTSYHHFVPGEWSNKYKMTKSVSVQDYNLKTYEGLFTLRALNEFLKLAPLKKKQCDWNPDDMKNVSELDGLCAFIKPTDAYKYGRESNWGATNKDLYVEFTGISVCTLPEKHGFVVQDIEVVTEPVSAEIFQKKHSLELIEYKYKRPFD